jgi:uncharacterized protein (TIGR02646 family)
MIQINRNISPLVLFRRIAGQYWYIRRGMAWVLDYNLHHLASRFVWGTWRIIGVDHNVQYLIAESLQMLSADHCHYCDRKQVRRGDVRATIDHFYPKTVRPMMAYYWPNLFLSCDSCQEYKNTYNSDHLLRFDDPLYNFDQYFSCDFFTGRVCSRLDITPEERLKARITLGILGINKDHRKESRIEEQDAFTATYLHLRNIDNFSFRYFIQ